MKRILLASLLGLSGCGFWHKDEQPVDSGLIYSNVSGSFWEVYEDKNYVSTMQIVDKNRDIQLDVTFRFLAFYNQETQPWPLGRSTEEACFSPNGLIDFDMDMSKNSQNTFKFDTQSIYLLKDGKKIPLDLKDKYKYKVTPTHGRYVEFHPNNKSADKPNFYAKFSPVELTCEDVEDMVFVFENIWVNGKKVDSIKIKLNYKDFEAVPKE